MKTIVALVAALGLLLVIAPTVKASETVQRQMSHLGYEISAEAAANSRDLSEEDREQVLAFQKRYGLPKSGHLGRHSQAALWELAGTTQLPKACRKDGFVICVDKHARVVRAVEDGEVLRVMDARFGAPGMETREGKRKVYRTGRDHVSSEYGSRMPFALFFDGGQAVHYSFEFADDPNSNSHGCVGLRDWKGSRWLFNNSPVGTKVVIYDKPPKQPEPLRAL